MFKPLEEAFKSCNLEDDDRGNFVSIRSDLKSNCQFLITHLLCSNLSKGRKVLFISLHETFSHNVAIASKLGINLQKHIQNGLLRVIDCTELIVQSNDQDKNDPFYFMFSDNDQDYSLKNFFKLFQKNITDWQLEKDNFIPYTIIIDRINVFYSLGIPQKEVNLFVKRVLSHLYSPVSNKEEFLSRRALGSLYISTEILSSEDSKLMADAMSAEADHTLFINQLKTGRSADVDGNLGIIYNTPTGLVDVKSYQYKVHEKSLNLFSHGMASSVI